MEHIRELRNRLLKALLGLAVGVAIGWFLFRQSWNFITAPYCDTAIQGLTGCGKDGHPLIVTGVFDPFFVRLKVAFVVGLVLSCPVWLYQLWAFIAPGLYKREKRWTYAFVGSAVPLFGLGAFFAYLAMARGLHFLLGLTPAGVKPFITIDTYFGYAIAMLLIFGVAFELPLVIVNVQRGGPSTGLPTKTEQSDLLQAMFGRNGDCPMVVLAPQSPADCFDIAIEASRIAITYMVPVLILSDGYLGNGSST